MLEYCVAKKLDLLAKKHLGGNKKTTRIKETQIHIYQHASLTCTCSYWTDLR